MKKIYHFKENETYLHKCSKMLLAHWLRKYYLRVDIESQFCMYGNIIFVPDVACYDENGICDIFEVVYKSDITEDKYNRINNYCDINKIDLIMYTIHVNYVMKQTKELDYENIINSCMDIYPFIGNSNFDNEPF